VIPLGHATETIEFGAACGGTCDLRTISLAGGSIFAEETFSDPACPGVCQPNPAEPSSGTLTDVVVGGTGIFTGATGTLTGSVRAAGPQSQIKFRARSASIPNPDGGWLASRRWHPCLP
jgi:hypothetical protein